MVKRPKKDKIVKEPSPDKYCTNCSIKLENTKKWSDTCVSCYYEIKRNQEGCMFT